MSEALIISRPDSVMSWKALVTAGMCMFVLCVCYLESCRVGSPGKNRTSCSHRGLSWEAASVGFISLFCLICHLLVLSYKIIVVSKSSRQLLFSALSLIKPDFFFVCYIPQSFPLHFSWLGVKNQIFIYLSILFFSVVYYRPSMFALHWPKGRPGTSDVSPTLESQGCYLILLFYVLSCHSAVALIWPSWLTGR